MSGLEAESTIGAPLTDTLTLPRPAGDAQFEPITRTESASPIEAVKPSAGEVRTTSGVFEQDTALNTFRRPPVTELPASDDSMSADLMSSAFVPYNVAPGKCDITSAAAPETCGVAIEVPLNVS